ncbi:YopX family protein [Bacillus sp. Hm123]|uniref:YopX family protein n=1 Tax=Bacillus sp. Hm123 TaxID=3450745 RepID=UPI003F41CE68
MSRERKFRSWHKADRKMYEVYGFSQGKWFLRGKTFPMPSGAVEVMQYTGLKDRNGVEIYEGDVVQFTYAGGGSAESISDVRFEKGCFTFEEKTPFGHSYRSILGKALSLDGNVTIEVIGNRFDNPELIQCD